jgi:hypothetical protein
MEEGGLGDGRGAQGTRLMGGFSGGNAGAVNFASCFSGCT